MPRFEPIPDTNINVAVQQKLSDETAIHFSRSFYGALAEGDPLNRAMTEARMSLHVDYGLDVEWAIPALYSRLSDGVIFGRPEIVT